MTNCQHYIYEYITKMDYFSILIKLYINLFHYYFKAVTLLNVNFFRVAF